MMGLRFGFNLLPTLLPEERVLFVKKWVGFCTGLSFPNYRWCFSLPPILELGFFVTDRRVLYVGHILRLLRQEFDQCFEAQQSRSGEDFIKKVRTGRHWLCGPYVEVVSESTRGHWYRSRRARIRVYMKDADNVCEVIRQLFMGNVDEE